MPRIPYQDPDAEKEYQRIQKESSKPSAPPTQEDNTIRDTIRNMLDVDGKDDRTNTDRFNQRLGIGKYRK